MCQRNCRVCRKASRDIDVFLSGTVNHPYHSDKDPVVLDVLGLPDIRLRIVEGFEGTESYTRTSDDRR